MRQVTKNREELLRQCAEAQLVLPYAENTDSLRESVELGERTAPNRIVCQPMEGCDGNTDGTPGELTVRRYKRLVRGGAGIVWFEATAVLPEGRANPRQLMINSANVDRFKALVEELKELGLKTNGYAPLILMQATHSGRYSKPNGVPEPLIAYQNPIFEKDNPIDPSRIVSDDYLDMVRDQLVDGAKLAEQAGFDGVDIKACHRYLNSELLSAYTRPGRYGGSLENRTRLLCESVMGAAALCRASFLVSCRLNVYDGFPYPYGFGVMEGAGTDFDPTEPIWLMRKLSSLGVHFVNCTMGNPYFNPHVNRPFARGTYEPKEHPLQGVKRMLDGIGVIREAVPEMKLICSGLSYLGTCAPNVASAYIADGRFDLAGFGRTALAYPEFANDILHNGHMEENKICLCCSKCTEIMRQKGGTPGCVIRDRDVYAPIYREFTGGKNG